MTDGDSFPLMPLTNEEYDRIAEAMTLDGFLAPMLEDLKDDLRADHPVWFDFAERVNRVGVTTWTSYDIDVEDYHVNHLVPVVVRLMARAMNSFCACVLLANRGLTVEAGTHARSVYEAAFWLAWFENRPNMAIREFVMDDLISQRGLLKDEINLTPEGSGKHQRLVQKLADIEKSIPSGQGKANMFDIATDGGFGPQYAAYRVLCAHAAHASVTSTNRYLRVFGPGEAGHELSPDREGIPQILNFGIHAMMTATMNFAMIVDHGEGIERISNLITEWSLFSGGLVTSVE